MIDGEASTVEYVKPISIDAAIDQPVPVHVRSNTRGSRRRR